MMVMSEDGGPSSMTPERTYGDCLTILKLWVAWNEALNLCFFQRIWLDEEEFAALT